jgi:hypothetical protein
LINWFIDWSIDWLDCFPSLASIAWVLIGLDWPGHEDLRDALVAGQTPPVQRGASLPKEEGSELSEEEPEEPVEEASEDNDEDMVGDPIGYISIPRTAKQADSFAFSLWACWFKDRPGLGNMISENLSMGRMVHNGCEYILALYINISQQIW